MHHIHHFGAGESVACVILIIAIVLAWNGRRGGPL